MQLVCRECMKTAWSGQWFFSQYYIHLPRKPVRRDLLLFEDGKRQLKRASTLFLCFLLICYPYISLHQFLKFLILVYILYSLLVQDQLMWDDVWSYCVIALYVSHVILLFPWTAELPPYPVLLEDEDRPFHVPVMTCDGSLDFKAVEGDDPLEICIRISGSEGEEVIANVITEDETATGIHI